MDFGEMLRILRRRWIVATVGVLLTLVATLGAYKAWPNKYQSSDEITLIGSKSMANATGNGGNPYLSVADLDPVASILAGNVSSDQAVKQLRALGVTYTYTVEVPQFAAGPFLQITVTGKLPSEVLQQLPIVTRFTEQRMTQLQQETAIPTPPNAILTTQMIVPPSTPTKVLKTKLELVAGVFVVFFVGTLITIAIVDVRRRKTGKRHADATPAPAGPDDGGADVALDEGSELSEAGPPWARYQAYQDPASPSRVR
jgi:capsular polysaccharide biosynthesis protein